MRAPIVAAMVVGIATLTACQDVCIVCPEQDDNGLVIDLDFEVIDIYTGGVGNGAVGDYRPEGDGTMLPIARLFIEIWQDNGDPGVSVDDVLLDYGKTDSDGAFQFAGCFDDPEDYSMLYVRTRFWGEKYATDEEIINDDYHSWEMRVGGGYQQGQQPPGGALLDQLYTLEIPNNGNCSHYSAPVVLELSAAEQTLINDLGECTTADDTDPCKDWMIQTGLQFYAMQQSMERAGWPSTYGEDCAQFPGTCTEDSILINVGKLETEEPCPGNSCNSGHANIYMGEGHTQSAGVVAHELGHTLMANAAAYNGTSICNGGYWFDGTDGHGDTTLEYESTAVSEGWADFIRAVSWFDESYADPTPGSYDAEDSFASCAGDVHRMESAVASAFWDLYDYHFDSEITADFGYAEDHVHAPIAFIADVLSEYPDGNGNGQSCEDGPDQPNMYDYYMHLVNYWNSQVQPWPSALQPNDVMDPLDCNNALFEVIFYLNCMYWQDNNYGFCLP